ncbi:MAG: hypothetical protein IPO41_01960 [Acidobacteria bacterium]|nr:hypothetical protein [Acidobacteriota bacterium]
MYGSGFRCYVGGMFTNRPQHLTTSQQPTFKLPAFQEDKRLAFVDSVCATLMTSRFGDGAMYTLNRRFRGTADEPFDYLSLLEEEPCGWHEARENHLVGFSTGRVLPGQNRVALPAEQDLLISGSGASCESPGRGGPTVKPPAHAGGSPSRGSPIFSGTLFFASSFATLASFA